MEAYWSWWFVAVVLVIIEMFSGTFYLIAVALGLAVAGAAAYIGVAWGVQVVVAAVLCSVSVAGIYRWKSTLTRTHQEEKVNFANDIGQTVFVASWTDERHARVKYRGAEWDAKLTPVALVDSSRQAWQIKEIQGNILVIE